MRLTPVAQWADSGFDTIDLLHVIAQKLQFSSEFQSNFCCEMQKVLLFYYFASNIFALRNFPV